MFLPILTRISASFASPYKPFGFAITHLPWQWLVKIFAPNGMRLSCNAIPLSHLWQWFCGFSTKVSPPTLGFPTELVESNIVGGLFKDRKFHTTSNVSSKYEKMVNKPSEEEVIEVGK